ncbi:hypothetical protein [Glaciihabitans sp. dw_435]|uniref:hypothetical protein n=1 Tax=Glaciihabitans sp. dw_435 TaxID=2720081 RepID=UPI001BD61A34|nr:hypothetical protein [Glaciihabitans sp. dw_435]
MIAVSRSLDLSPQQVDPLSWFTGPRLPVTVAVASVVLALVTTALYWNQWTSVALQFAAMPFFLVAGLAAAHFVQPHRPPITPPQAAIVLGISAAGVIVSAFGTVGSSVPVEQWWAEIGIAVTLGSLAPYSSARRMIGYSIASATFIVIVANIVYIPAPSAWPWGGRLVIAVGPVLVAAIASTVFSYTVVDRTLRLLETRSGHPDQDAADRADDLIRSENIARVRARVIPFIESVATAGVITPEDRALAGQLARQLRTDLVAAANRSWLDDLAMESGIIVTDPGRAAHRMDEAQRASLRGLLLAVLDTPVMDRDSPLIELRERADGSTAVALSLDVDLPEGRRLMLIAPYYLTVGSVVDNLSWDDGRSLSLKFQLPAPEKRP